MTKVWILFTLNVYKILLVITMLFDKESTGSLMFEFSQQFLVFLVVVTYILGFIAETLTVGMDAVREVQLLLSQNSASISSKKK